MLFPPFSKRRRHLLQRKRRKCSVGKKERENIFLSFPLALVRIGVTGPTCKSPPPKKKWSRRSVRWSDNQTKQATHPSNQSQNPEKAHFVFPEKRRMERRQDSTNNTSPPPSVVASCCWGGWGCQPKRGGGSAGVKVPFSKKGGKGKRFHSIYSSTKQYGEDHMGKYGPSWTFSPPTPAVKISP